MSITELTEVKVYLAMKYTWNLLPCLFIYSFIYLFIYFSHQHPEEDNREHSHGCHHFFTFVCDGRNQF